MRQLLDAAKQKLNRHEGAIRAQQEVGLIAASALSQISKAERQVLTQAVTDLQEQQCGAT